ncbi:hypothetical protein [Mycobacterium kubicae]|uniref:Uncharacterized protein n=1 Tax=Mycobacterium kubicae TaxID=120959 RepID=A0AAX1J2R4_9MYCO|nr:hypothetical protein [Mycobacterium kubicae]MCV7096084.1 hypothetical protein [Mycobacterium kubicae]QPI35754.1 hypothetical protein I2456_14175 [Mycobacterium kubicae]
MSAAFPRTLVLAVLMVATTWLVSACGPTTSPTPSSPTRTTTLAAVGALLPTP